MFEVGKPWLGRALGPLGPYGVVLLVALALLALTPLALAQAPAEEADEAEAGLVAQGVVISDPAYSSLQTAWKEVQADLERHAWVEATGRLSYLVDLRTDLGLPNLSEFSSVLMRAAEEASAHDANDAATALAETAAVLSPDLVSARLALARHRFDSAPLGVADIIRPLNNALERVPKDLAATITLMGNGAALWVVLTLIMSVLIAVALCARYSSYAASDIRRLLPPGVTLAQSRVLLFILLFTPLLTGLGVLVSALFWMVLFGSYLRLTERIVVLMTVLAIAATPTQTTRSVQAMTYAAHPASVLHRCSSGLCSDDDRTLLKRWVADNVYSHESHFVLALTLLRQAGTKGDATSFDQAQRYAQTAHDLRATRETLTLLGNLAYMRGTRQCAGLREGAAGTNARIAKAQNEALDYWKQALSKSSTYVPALYNSSVVLTQLGQHTDADPLLERAMHVDYEHVLSWTKGVSRDGANLVTCKLGLFVNRQVMMPQLRSEGLAYAVRHEPVPTDGLLVPFSGLATGRLGVSFLGVAGLGAAALLLLLWMLSRALRPTQACIECSAPAVPATRLETQDGPVCARCVEDDVRRAFVDAKKQWVREQEMELMTKRRAQRARLVTWLLPGFGHLMRAKALRGFGFLLVALGCLFVGLDLHSLVDDPYAPLEASQARAIAFGIPGGLAYLLAIIDAHAGGTNE